MILIIAEKPSVARDIARVVGAHRSGQGYLEGSAYTVTWAIGHLVTLPQPSEIHPEWQAWRKETLPMLPKAWPLKVIDRTKAQFKIIKTLMKSCESLICATDAGREGELIFRYIYEAAHCKKPFKRLWISSLTPDAIQDGLRHLQEGHQYNCLAEAARARSCADWLIGMNLSRTYAITFGEKLFVGRVQTPTLAMIVKRDLEIKNFKSENYFEISATFSSREGAVPPSSYEGYYLGEESELDKKNSGLPTHPQGLPSLPKKLAHDPLFVQKTVDRIQAGEAQIQRVEAKRVQQPPPLLYDLTELQRHGNRLYGFSASKTLEVAQALYERHKLISYPRTDSQYLSKSVANTLPQILEAIRKPYEQAILETTGRHPLGSRFVNDQEVGDHHALIPTGVSTANLTLPRLTDDERKIYDLICRRLLAAYQGDFITSVTTLLTEVRSSSESPFGLVPCIDLFRSQGVVVEQLGWKKLEFSADERRSDPSWRPYEKRLPSGLRMGSLLSILKVQSESKKTMPPPHLTEAALLTAMESAGKTLDDRELAAILKKSGLGTPATRAGIIETLLKRGYLVRRGKSLIATELGVRLIEIVHPSVKSPELTAKWERALSQIQSGKQTLKSFMIDLQAELIVRVNEVLSSDVRRSPEVPQFFDRLSSPILKIISKGPLAAGRLFAEIVQLGEKIERNDFEQVVQALSACGKVQVVEQQFEKEGKVIRYRKVSLCKRIE